MPGSVSSTPRRSSSSNAFDINSMLQMGIQMRQLAAQESARNFRQEQSLRAEAREIQLFDQRTKRNTQLITQNDLAAEALEVDRPFEARRVKAAATKAELDVTSGFQANLGQALRNTRDLLTFGADVAQSKNAARSSKVLADAREYEFNLVKDRAMKTQQRTEHDAASTLLANIITMPPEQQSLAAQDAIDQKLIPEYMQDNYKALVNNPYKGRQKPEVALLQLEAENARKALDYYTKHGDSNKVADMTDYLRTISGRSQLLHDRGVGDEEILNINKLIGSALVGAANDVTSHGLSWSNKNWSGVLREMRNDAFNWINTGVGESMWAAGQSLRLTEPQMLWSLSPTSTVEWTDPTTKTQQTTTARQAIAAAYAFPDVNDVSGKPKEHWAFKQEQVDKVKEVLSFIFEPGKRHPGLSTINRVNEERIGRLKKRTKESTKALDRRDAERAFESSDAAKRLESLGKSLRFLEGGGL